MVQDVEKTTWVRDVLTKNGLSDVGYNWFTETMSYPTDLVKQAQAQTLYNTSDWSDTARAAWRITNAREAAVACLNSTDALGKALRAEAAVLVDEINTLRQQIIGVATLIWDPASMANATGLTSANVAVAGAAFGDVVDVAAPYDLAGVTVTGYVRAAGSVSIRLHNGTGGAVNLASGTWTVIVRRMAVLPDRTLAQARTAIVGKINAGTVDA